MSKYQAQYERNMSLRDAERREVVDLSCGCKLQDGAFSNQCAALKAAVETLSRTGDGPEGYDAAMFIQRHQMGFSF